MYYKYDYAVLGGDMRQVYLVEELAGCGKCVCHFALCDIPDERRFSEASFVAAVSSLEEACCLSSCIIGPIPLCRNNSCFNQNVFEEPILIDQIFSSLKPGQTFLGGCISEKLKSAAVQRGVRVFDLMKDPSLSYYNTIATAEGVICEAIRQSPRNLHKSSCAILGYGKCGRTLCRYLKGMACTTFVAARREEIRTQASLVSDRTGTIEEFVSRAGEFDFVFNTVPAVVITREALVKMKPAVTIIDIASAPGGVDFETAQKLGIKASLCPGLPGTYAPASSAEAIKEMMERIFKE